METTSPAALDALVASARTHDPPARNPTNLPTAKELAFGVLGFGVLGTCAALGADAGSAARIAPSALIAGVGALGLTAPALLVGHQFLGLEAPIGHLAADLGQAFRRTGGMALGLSPFVLFFAATSGLASGLLVLAMAGIGVAGLAHAYSGMLASERAAGNPDQHLLREMKMQPLVFGWMLLTGLVGLRIAVHIAQGA